MPTYRATLTVITPVHIGTGQVLQRRYDYVVHQGRTWRLHVDRVLEAFEARWRQQAQGGRYPLPGDLLTEADFANRALFRYVLPGRPRSPRPFAELREFIKDTWDRPYIPGSSLKGAIRTALAWAGWAERIPALRRNDIGRNPRFAGQPLEKRLFGPDPNHDLLRALQVSDFFGPQKPGEGLVVVNAQVVTSRGLQAPIELEAAVDVTFEGTLKVDDYLFSRHARRLGFGDRRDWLTPQGLLERLRRHSQARLEHLTEHFYRFARRGIPGAEKVAKFYEELRDFDLPKNHAFLAIGWGTGWDGKTFWTHLQEDAHLFEALVKQFRLQRRPKGASKRKPGDPFPASRRVVVQKERVAAPFGWVVLALEEGDDG